jgi:ariadne-1
MTCRKCRHEFCWMCMGIWSEHGTSWYNCNRFEEKSGSDARDAQAKSRQSLERYLHYYNRYANHEQSAKLDKDIYLKTEKKMQQLQNTTGTYYRWQGALVDWFRGLLLSLNDDKIP